jgi:glutamine amidotransferase
MNRKIGVIDLGVGNFSSVVNLIRRVGGDAELLSLNCELNDFDVVMLPGVGAFDTAMKIINDSSLAERLRSYVSDPSKIFIGICLGMQILSDGSEEGSLPGLGLIPGNVRKFNFREELLKLPIPHMGWNRVSFEKGTFSGYLSEPQRFYFVHSFYYDCDEQYVLSRTNYGRNFISAVRSNNVFGFQFHPEKSGKNGMALIKELLEKVCV